jgi:hypothetical protein
MIPIFVCCFVNVYKMVVALLDSFTNFVHLSSKDAPLQMKKLPNPFLDKINTSTAGKSSPKITATSVASKLRIVYSRPI